MNTTLKLLPLTAEATLEQVGGKALNLMRMARAGFPVPSGFVVPTDAYQTFVAQNGLDAVIAEASADATPGDPGSLEIASRCIREAFHRGRLPAGLPGALEQAWRNLGEHPVAVRSSATAEDLPDLSFAGQQETYLNVVGVGALCRAVVDCWASLWTARAIGYRARNGIPHEEAALAVVVQRMVPADVSGVLFTANPVSGNRTETVIEATLGLGDILVAGRVEPDRYVVAREGNRLRIMDRKLGAKATIVRSRPEGGIQMEEEEHTDSPALPDPVILRLAEWGERIQALFASPQDVEWAVVDPEGEASIWILQSRPITSLYPLPENLPREPLRVLVGLHTVQGVHEPLTPLGREVLAHPVLGVGRVFGYPVDPYDQRTIFEAGERLWINITPLLRHPLGRRVFPRFFGAADPPTARLARQLLDDPRLGPGRALPPVRALIHGVGFALRMAAAAVRAWRDPDTARQRFEEAVQEALGLLDAALDAAEPDDPWATLQAVVEAVPRLNDFFPEVLLPKGFSLVLAGLVPFFGILQRQARRAAQALSEPSLARLPLEITRGLPHNVTTEMDLALWDMARRLREDPEAAAWLVDHSVEALATAWRQGEAPRAVRAVVEPFLERYGTRAVGEVDIGRPRWEEDPRQVLRTLRGYLLITDPDQAPDVVFARGAQQAQTALEHLEVAVRRLPGGRWRARLVHWAATRYRALGGMREAPKFAAVRVLGRVRRALLAAARTLHARGELDSPDDLFYLRLEELARCAALRQLLPEAREAIRQRRVVAAREARRRRLPRLLLSDGTAFYEAPPEAPDATADEAHVLRGDPVSPGVVEGRVRVVFDPHDGRLEPGEILVCRGTDPAWTPLFLVAGGLVMEVGGTMTHGSVVAREYGIPAVVGVHRATERLCTGQRVRVDGSQGVVAILEKGGD